MRFRAFAFASLLIAAAISWLAWSAARGLVESAEGVSLQRARVQEVQEVPEEAPPPPAQQERQEETRPEELVVPPRPSAREELEAARARLAEEGLREPLLREPPSDDLLGHREGPPEEAPGTAAEGGAPPGEGAPVAADEEGAAVEEGAAGQGGVEEGAEEAGPPAKEAETEVAEVEARIDELQRQLDELLASQQASQQEIEALREELAAREEELRFLEENRQLRIERIDESIAGIQELEPLLASGTLDVDGDLARIAGTLGSASSDAAQYAGQDEARLSEQASRAVEAAREALTRDDLYAARMSLGIALSQARAARQAAESR